MYDWIVDIDLITNINKEGWKMNFSNSFLKKNNLSSDLIEKNNKQMKNLESKENTINNFNY